MAIQADTLLLDEKVRQYHEFMSERVMKAPFKCFNDKMKFDMLLGLFSLYQLMERVVEIYLNYF